MPYGTNAFTDRYNDYKQPTVIDYDKSVTVGSLLNVDNLPIDDILNTHKKDVEEAYTEILSFNPFFAGDKYTTFTTVVDKKLVWDEKKIEELKNNSDWLFMFRKHLKKAKAKFVSNKKL